MAESSTNTLLQESQTAGQARIDASNTRTGTKQPANNDHGWSKDMAQTMSFTLFAFTGLVLLLATALLWKRDVSAVQIVRLFMLVLIVSLSSFLLVVGYDQSQLTPIIGLFGAICGYLLGHTPSGPSSTPAQAAAAEKEEA